jgi:hypothetical protein
MGSREQCGSAVLIAKVTSRKSLLAWPGVGRDGLPATAGLAASPRHATARTVAVFTQLRSPLMRMHMPVESAFISNSRSDCGSWAGRFTKSRNTPPGRGGLQLPGPARVAPTPLRRRTTAEGDVRT